MTNLTLNNKEKALIIAIRTRFQYGEVIVVVKGGSPVYIKQAWESKDLGGDPLTDSKE